MTETKVKKRRTLFHKIVNVFIGMFIGIFFLVVLFIGFSQTKTFREFLRKNVVSIANDNINGKLSIERIDGTILTSLILRNTMLTMEQDTVLNAKKIELETSPLRIFLKQIHVRNFEIADAKINLIKDSAGNYNISKLVKPTPEDTSKSEFPFTIKVSSFNLTNVSLKSASLENKYSKKQYSSLTLDDFRVDSLFLSLNAYTNISKNDYLVNIDEIKCLTNLSNFTLKNLSGKLELTDSYARVTDFAVQTKSTDFDLDATIEDFHLFKNFTYAKLKQSPVKLRLTTRIFNFSELSSLVPATSMLKGVITTTVYASGKYGNMNVDKISLDYLKTHLEGTATVSELQNPANMYIKAKIWNSYINQPDVAQLLPDIGLSVYKNLRISDINVDFEGKPTDFKTKFSVNFPKGNIKGTAKLDFSGKNIKYDVVLNTSHLDLSPIIQSPTNINIDAVAQGEGTNPKTLTSKIRMNLIQTSFQQYLVDSLKLNLDAGNGIADIKLETLAQKAKIKVNGNIDFDNVQNPDYVFIGKVTNVDLKSILNNPSLASDINFNFNFKGKSFDVDKMDSRLVFKLDSSMVSDVNISPTELKLSYSKPSDNFRVINFTSDFADINIKGNFKTTDALSVIGYEANTMTNLIKRKINSLNPWALFGDTTKSREFENTFNKKEIVPEIVDKDFYMNYELVLRDLSKVKTISGLKDFNIEGKISGSIKNNKDRFELSSDVKLDRFKMVSKENVFYVTNFNVNLNAGRYNGSVVPESIFGELELSIERIFSGTDIKNVVFNLDLNKNIIDYSMSASLDTTLNTSINGTADLTENSLKVSVRNLVVEYLKSKWQNEGDLLAFYSKDYFELQKFKMIRNGSSIDFSGKIFGNGKEDILAKVSNLDCDLINILTDQKPNTVSGKINIEAKLDGYLHDPVIKIQAGMDNIVAKGVKFGFLRANFAYANKLFNTDIKVLDTTLNYSNPTFLIEGYIPIDLAFVGATERLVKNKELGLSVKSKEFDLSAFNNLVPYVKNLGGKLFTDLNVGGTFDNLDLKGKLTLSNGAFILTQNNLPYGLDVDLSFDKSSILLENVNLRNTGKTDNKGKLTAKGSFDFSDNTADISINGDLCVLSQASKSALPYMYGDLSIKTDGDWKFTYKKGVSYFDGIVLLKNMNITVLPLQSTYSSTSDYVYHYVIDSSKIDKRQEEYKQLVAVSQKYSPIKKNRPASASNFGYNVRIKTEDESVFNFVLNQESNQKLKAFVKGDLLFENGGVAQGEFRLLEGSELTFFKTFSAEGKIYFERDMMNPRLDITATYQGEHSDSLKTEDVAVKIKLEGSMDKLGENLNKNSSNIAVYEGETNINNGVPSTDKNAADAITFILLGKFLSEVTTGDKASMSGLLNPKEYSNSALSGVLSAFANEYLGDVVRNIDLEQRGSSTRLSVSGKIQKLKYSLGTKTEEFQDISKANLKLEYPFNDNFMIRFERKDPILESMSTTEKVNEIAIKYKFVF